MKGPYSEECASATSALSHSDFLAAETAAGVVTGPLLQRHMSVALLLESGNTEYCTTTNNAQDCAVDFTAIDEVIEWKNKCVEVGGKFVTSSIFISCSKSADDVDITGVSSFTIMLKNVADCHADICTIEEFGAAAEKGSAAAANWLAHQDDSFTCKSQVKSFEKVE